MTDNKDQNDLYREVILDHSRQPRNFGRPHAHTHEAEGFNPLCGDRLQLFLSVDEGCISSADFEGTGCAISIASASLLTEVVRGMPIEKIAGCVDAVAGMLVSDGSHDAVCDAHLTQLRALENVRDYPARVKCATLAWETLGAALAGDT